MGMATMRPAATPTDAGLLLPNLTLVQKVKAEAQADEAFVEIRAAKE